VLGGGPQPPPFLSPFSAAAGGQPAPPLSPNITSFQPPPAVIVPGMPSLGPPAVPQIVQLAPGAPAGGAALGGGDNGGLPVDANPTIAFPDDDMDDGAARGRWRR
jgi:hypothetical protein